jgi:hypothetical protein
MSKTTKPKTGFTNFGIWDILFSYILFSDVLVSDIFIYEIYLP